MHGAVLRLSIELVQRAIRGPAAHDAVARCCRSRSAGARRLSPGSSCPSASIVPAAAPWPRRAARSGGPSPARSRHKRRTRTGPRGMLRSSSRPPASGPRASPGRPRTPPAPARAPAGRSARASASRCRRAPAGRVATRPRRAPPARRAGTPRTSRAARAGSPSRGASPPRGRSPRAARALALAVGVDDADLVDVRPGYAGDHEVRLVDSLRSATGGCGPRSG